MAAPFFVADALARYVLRLLGVRVHLAQRLNDRVQVSQETFALSAWQHRQDTVVHPSGPWLRTFQQPSALFRELHGIGARIISGPPTLNEAFFQHPSNDVGKSRAIDPGFLNETRLAQTFVLGDRDKNSKLPRREIPPDHFRLKDVTGALTSPVQEMNGRALEPPRVGLTCHGSGRPLIAAVVGVLGPPAAQASSR